MGYRIRHPRHRKGKPCYLCIKELEIECGLRPRLAPPPKGPGPGAHRP